MFTNGIGVHAPVNEVRWANTGDEKNQYLYSCSAFSFKIAYAYYPAPSRPDHIVTVTIDNKPVDSFILRANTRGSLMENKYSFADYGTAYGPHSISLKIVNANPSDSNNADSHINIIEPKLICRDQLSSFEQAKPKAGPSQPAPSPAPTSDPVATPTAVTKFVSDEPFIDEQNGYGPIERDTNIGDRAAGDGTGPVRIGGIAYDKGLGMHSDGQVSIDLAGRCSRFQSDVGIDDTAGDNGSVTFRVLGDGVLLTDTGTLRGTDAARQLDVDVATVTKLTLEVTHAGDNWDWDHASWGGARLTCAA